MLRTSFLKLDGYRMLLGLEGEVTWEQSKFKLQNALNAVIGEYADVLIDVTNVKYMDPPSAGLLIVAHAEGRICGTTLRLVGLQESGIDLMLLVKLLTTFDDYEPQQFNNPRAA
jgi:anti-anti-sigma regulatory factor